jgi:hypothetical protein
MIMVFNKNQLERRTRRIHGPGVYIVVVGTGDSHMLVDVQRVGLLSEIVRPDESTSFGGVVVFGAVRKVPPKSTYTGQPTVRLAERCFCSRTLQGSVPFDLHLIWIEPRLTLPPPRLLPHLSQPGSVSTHKSLLLPRRLVRGLPDRRLSAWASFYVSSLPPCSSGRGLYRTSWTGRLVGGGGGFLGGCR